MGFVKVVKNRAYYKRFQVKFRRRRENKTDYYARQRLILNDKNKYKSAKYRFVVRFTNKDVICQIIAADLTHDRVICSAYAHELRRYGLKVVNKNYATAYATGLLLARRVNAKFNLEYTGQEDVDGEDFIVEAEDDDSNKPFFALLDVGLKRTTTGSRIFGALKGAVDGGVEIPHNNKRFPGSKKDDEGEFEYDPKVHRDYIFGGHVKTYMEHLKSESEDDYKRQFSAYVAAGIGPADVEKMYKGIHAAIRADPNKARGADELGNAKKRTKAKPAEYKKVRHPGRFTKQSVQQRKNRLKQKLTAAGVQSIGPAV